MLPYNTVKVNIPTMLFFSQALERSDVAGLKRKIKCYHLPKYQNNPSSHQLPGLLGREKFTGHHLVCLTVYTKTAAESLALCRHEFAAK